MPHSNIVPCAPRRSPPCIPVLSYYTGPGELTFSLGGVSFRHTRDFSEISVNKINNSRKSDYPEIFRNAKNIFRKKKHHTIGTKK
jgi:hypothetical protein